MHDNKTRECKLFDGQIDELFNNCKEASFASYPSFSECSSAFDASSDDGCYVRTVFDISRFKYSFKMEVIFSLS